jgi:hypothetical protein
LSGTVKQQNFLSNEKGFGFNKKDALFLSIDVGLRIFADNDVSSFADFEVNLVAVPFQVGIDSKPATTNVARIRFLAYKKKQKTILNDNSKKLVLSKVFKKSAQTETKIFGSFGTNNFFSVDCIVKVY